MTALSLPFILHDDDVDDRHIEDGCCDDDVACTDDDDVMKDGTLPGVKIMCKNKRKPTSTY